jgi:tripartite-type tricarboxylate transporter receptor subunit TctC
MPTSAKPERLTSARFAWRRRVLQTLPVIAALPAAPSFAQSAYPDRPIRFVVPVAPGSATDTVARQVSTQLTKAWNVPVIVDNRPGAGGTVGTEVAAKAPADGYTLLFTLSSHYTNPWLDKTPYDPAADFEPVAKLVSTALVMVTAVDSRFRTVRDVIEAERRAPGSVNFASAGEGTTSHMGGALLNAVAGIRMMHVPYKNGSQAMVETANGLVQVAFSGPAALPLVRSGKLRILAVTGAKRSQQLPDTPTIDESGGLSGYDLTSPVWAFVPKGVSPDIVAKLSDAFGMIVQTPEFRAMCAAQSLDPTYEPAPVVRAAVAAEVEKWRKLVQATRT